MNVFSDISKYFQVLAKYLDCEPQGEGPNLLSDNVISTCISEDVDAK
jgi:hypothetical protein